MHDLSSFSYQTSKFTPPSQIIEQAGCTFNINLSKASANATNDDVRVKRALVMEMLPDLVLDLVVIVQHWRPTNYED
jgi:hypothetical protein